VEAVHTVTGRICVFSAVYSGCRTNSVTAVIPVTGGISPVAVVDKFPVAG